jgi:hypothetical protein
MMIQENDNNINNAGNNQNNAIAVPQPQPVADVVSAAAIVSPVHQVNIHHQLMMMNNLETNMNNSFDRLAVSFLQQMIALRQELQTINCNIRSYGGGTSAFLRRIHHLQAGFTVCCTYKRKYNALLLTTRQISTTVTNPSEITIRHEFEVWFQDTSVNLIVRCPIVAFPDVMLCRTVPNAVHGTCGT